MRNIVIVGLNGSYLSSLGCLVDAHTLLTELFSSNEALGFYSRIQTELDLVTADGAPFALAGGRTMKADRPWKDVSRPRLVFLPSFQVPDPTQLAALIDQSKLLYGWLRKMRAEGAVIGASGAAAIHLLAANIIERGPVSMSFRLVDEARALFPDMTIAPPDTITAAGFGVLTCADRTKGAEFASRLVSEAISENSLQWLALRQGFSNSPSAFSSGLSQDTLVARAQLILQEQFTANLPLANLAQRLSVSHHTLMRRFKKSLGIAPGEFRQRVRINAGAAMLRETGRSVAEIALLVGYSDARAFRESFLRRMGASPSAYRRSVKKGAGSR